MMPTQSGYLTIILSLYHLLNPWAMFVLKVNYIALMGISVVVFDDDSNHVK